MVLLSKEKRQRNQKHIGAAVKQARKDLDMTQRELAKALGLDYFTLISQIENGYITLPPTMWTPIAEALSIPPGPWAVRCLLEIQPDVYEALFQDRSLDEVIKAIERNRSIVLKTDSKRP